MLNHHTMDLMRNYYNVIKKIKKRKKSVIKDTLFDYFDN